MTIPKMSMTSVMNAAAYTCIGIVNAITITKTIIFAILDAFDIEM